ncbi:MAG: radical SAM protein [Candidatus Moranbacteria bacterium]|jgi:radical SAM protein with 4Fe4S-binding SPASM domain|nr:radical SAM protein [Candidatus Moranbacteria bacterium]MDD5652086.1 radical SAM protein [Candidatus Moranbacteria bacterium]MDX9855997.1 radical SAM protein [Candidatus Moranbacteria bacterium]
MKGFGREELLELAWEKPILAQIEITNKCNQECKFCYTGKKAMETKHDLTLVQWQGIILKLRNLGIRRLDFTGRESFMYPDFTALISWCKELGFELRINTNGTSDVSNVLKFADEIVFSVHGIGSVHDEIVGKANSFNLVEANIRRAFANGVNGIRTSINMSLVRSNYHQMMEVFTYFDSRYDIYKFAPSIPVPSRFGNVFEDIALVLNRELLEDYINNLKKIPKNKLTLKHGFHSIFIDDREHYINSGLLLPNCAAGKYKLVVESDGKVFPCNFFKSEEFYCGNILTDNEHRIWKSGKGFERFRQLVLKDRIPEECHICLKKPRCYSGCRAWASNYEEGGFENVKDQRCEIRSAFIGG